MTCALAQVSRLRLVTLRSPHYRPLAVAKRERIGRAVRYPAWSIQTKT